MARLKSDSAQIAFDEIKDRINRYDLLPGDTVSDITLSKELDMSRTPIREAIHNLIQFKLVEKQRTKYVVMPISQVDINEILEAREAIEIQAAKILIEKHLLSEAMISELKNINQSVEIVNGVKNFNKIFKYDSLFHSKIIEFTGNSRLYEIMKNLSIQGERLRWISILTPSSYDKTVEEHNAIIDSFIKEDKDLAISRIHKHLETARNNYKTIDLDNSWLDVILSFKQMFNH